MRLIIARIHSLHLRKPHGMSGKNQVSVSITLNGEAIGDPADRWTVLPTGTITFDKGKYFKAIDVDGRTQPLDLRVVMSVDEPANKSVVGGELRHKVPWPYSPRLLEPARAEFIVEWEIEGFWHPTGSPSGIYACREDKSGTVLYNTAVDVHHQLRMEIHEVLPCPRGTGAFGPGPKRPVLNPRLVWSDGIHNKKPEVLIAGSDLNIIENPPVIPILPSDMTASAANCAKFRVTWYWPKTMKFTEDDIRLTWSVVSTGGGAARFFGRNWGRTVSLHGVTAGEINLEVRFENAQVAIYRAVVQPLITIPFRCTILNGDATRARFRPRSTIADMKQHMLVANRFLWQLGVTLKPFKNTTVGWIPSGSTMTITPVTGETGMFTALVPPAWTRSTPSAVPAGGADPTASQCAAVNSLPYVFNFAYIVLDPYAGVTGAGCYMDIAGAATLDDSGTPSTSWKHPSGINPDGSAAKITMTRLPNFAMFQDTRFPNRFCMYVNERNHDNMEFAITIAHELGHVLGLNHRVADPHDATYDDKVKYPPVQNVMNWAADPALGQDFDIIQARMIRFSPLLNPPAGKRPAPTP